MTRPTRDHLGVLLSAIVGKTGRWARRAGRSGRGRVLLAGMLVVALGVPTGVGLAVAMVLDEETDDAGPAARRVATIGVLAPLSGQNAQVGAAVRNAVTLAVEEANADRTVQGWTLEVAAHDDLSRPDGGAAGADALAGEDSVIGVVGPLSSTVARVSLPTLSGAGIPIISPSNAEPTLTLPETTEPDTEPARPYPSYFRLSGTDELLAEVAADYAVRTLGRSRISVVDGGPYFGTITLAERFARHARDDGASIQTVHRVNGYATDSEELDKTAAAIHDEAPDLVYLATGAAFAGELRGRLADEGVAVQVLGGDGLLSPGYVEQAGTLADGDVISDLSVPLTRMPATGAFVAAYSERFGGPVVDADADTGSVAVNSGDEMDDAGADDADRAGSEASRRDSGSSADPDDADGGNDVDGRGGDEGAEQNGDERDGRELTEEQREQEKALAELRAAAIPPAAAYAYDAARALIRAAAAVLPSRAEVGPRVRSDLVAAIGAGDFAGITGRVGFDERGDILHPDVVLYSLLGGRFVPLSIVTG